LHEQTFQTLTLQKLTCWTLTCGQLTFQTLTCQGLTCQALTFQGLRLSFFIVAGEQYLKAFGEHLRKLRIKQHLSIINTPVIS
jgi:hypothetical protein